MLPPFPDAAAVLINDLITAGIAGGSGHIGRETPSDLQDRLPFVAVARAGGPSDLVNDFPVVMVEVTAEDVVVAEEIAEQIRARVAPGPYVDGPIRNARGQIDRGECASGHTEVDTADPFLRRLVTTYRLVCRRLPAA
jgi:hypothetical protein